jgi:hypothetical protein
MWRLVVSLGLAALASCGTPSALSEEAASGLNRVGTGPATGRTDSTETGTAAAASYLGDVKSENIRASAQRQVTSTTSGHVQQGFTLGANVDAMRAIQEDPLVKSLIEELAALQAAEEPNTARMDEVPGRSSRLLWSVRGRPL